MTNEEKKLLTDIIICISSIDDHLEGRRVLEINPAIEISYARQIVDLRNKVIHAYDNVNDIVIWSVVMNHLPKLKSEANILIQE